MVADTIAVMDAAGVDDAHVLGVSMCGMVAQRLALGHRGRVRSLILGCTTARAVAGLPPWRMVAALWIRQLAPRQATELLVPLLYSERTRREAPERIREDLRMRAREATSPATIFAQMAAIGSHDARSRLPHLDGLDVTVIHGSEDALVRVGRGRELAARIPGARLHEIDDCGHLLLTDAQDAVMGAIDEHLRRAGAMPAAAA
jgi:pimeloyl-ACP methyl ester carboxylesterase